MKKFATISAVVFWTLLNLNSAQAEENKFIIKDFMPFEIPGVDYVIYPKDVYKISCKSPTEEKIDKFHTLEYFSFKPRLEYDKSQLIPEEIEQVKDMSYDLYDAVVTNLDGKEYFGAASFDMQSTIFSIEYSTDYESIPLIDDAIFKSDEKINASVSLFIDQNLNGFHERRQFSYYVISKENSQKSLHSLNCEIIQSPDYIKDIIEIFKQLYAETI